MFQTLTGDLYVQRYEQREDISYAVFENKHLQLRFSCTAASFSVEDSHFEESGNRTYYYPSYNETHAEQSHVDTGELELHREDISIEYTVAGDELFISSQICITAYAPTYFTFKAKPYAVEDSPMLVPASRVDKDGLLGISEKDSVCPVRNVETDFKTPVSEERLSEIFKSDRPAGLVRVHDTGLAKLLSD